METLVFCPFCNKQTVPVSKHLKTVRNASRQGRGVSHNEEELMILGDCKSCGKTKDEIKAQFGL